MWNKLGKTKTDKGNSPGECVPHIRGAIAYIKNKYYSL